MWVDLKHCFKVDMTFAYLHTQTSLRNLCHIFCSPIMFIQYPSMFGYSPMLKLIPIAKVSAQFLYFDFTDMGGWVEKALVCHAKGLGFDSQKKCIDIHTWNE